MPIREASQLFERVSKIKTKLELMEDVGLGYLTLGQGSPTLSGGEAQRIKLVTHLAGRGQPKTVILLDEPSIGLHMADIPRLLEVLHRLVDKGATVIVVEHNTDIMREADWLIDMGPGPGKAGGEVVYQGPAAGIKGVARSKTAPFLADLEDIAPLPFVVQPTLVRTTPRAAKAAAAKAAKTTEVPASKAITTRSSKVTSPKPRGPKPKATTSA